MNHEDGVSTSFFDVGKLEQTYLRTPITYHLLPIPLMMCLAFITPVILTSLLSLFQKSIWHHCNMYFLHVRNCILALDSVVYPAMRCFPKGTEITMCYGARPNDLLLVYSGGLSWCYLHWFSLVWFVFSSVLVSSLFPSLFSFLLFSYPVLPPHWLKHPFKTP